MQRKKSRPLRADGHEPTWSETLNTSLRTPVATRATTTKTVAAARAREAGKFAMFEVKMCVGGWMERGWKRKGRTEAKGVATVPVVKVWW